MDRDGEIRLTIKKLTGGHMAAKAPNTMAPHAAHAKGIKIVEYCLNFSANPTGEVLKLAILSSENLAIPSVIIPIPLPIFNGSLTNYAVADKLFLHNR
ncbi:MAG: hypothetical protein LBG86_00870 [Puniceicoccales bacterium]|nr:hypothetical protein [Puniceicoccales bacterium]